MSNKFLRRQTKQIIESKSREIFCSNSEFNLNFPSNLIKTSKYTPQIFFPKALLLQFYRVSNCYFLLIAILQCIPQISPLSPFSAITPLTIVIVLSLIREFCEDRIRQQSDEKTNAQEVLYFDNESGEFEKYTWGDIQVGDLIMIKDSQTFPADILFIISSNIHGLCYIETSSFDGEKNLKARAIPEQLKIEWGLPIIRFEGKLISSCPNSNLNDFSGVLSIMDKTVKLKAVNLLIRGSRLRNTKFVIGVVVYTGSETKIMKNSEKSKEKHSHMEQKTNEMVVYVFFFQLFLGMICVLGNFSWNYLYAKNHSYLQITDSPQLSCFLSFFTYFLLNNTMIPISLIVSLQFVKLAQAFFIIQDSDFIGTNIDAKESISVFSSSLNEELGQIEYIFSDKTGTLTCNIMEFKKISINGNSYGI